jgi:hypothetical protein
MDLTDEDQAAPGLGVPFPGTAGAVAVAALSDQRPQVWVVAAGDVMTTVMQHEGADFLWFPWQEFRPEGGRLGPATREVAATPLSGGRLQLWVITEDGVVQTTLKENADPNSDWIAWKQFLPHGEPLASQASDATAGRLSNGPGMGRP